MPAVLRPPVHRDIRLDRVELGWHHREALGVNSTQSQAASVEKLRDAGWLRALTAPIRREALPAHTSAAVGPAKIVRPAHIGARLRHRRALHGKARRLRV